MESESGRDSRDRPVSFRTPVTRNPGDLHDKLHAYRRNEVREYVVWRVWDRAIDWFVLRDDRYQRLQLDAEGQYQSEIFPGLWLAPAALLRSDLAQVLAVLQQGLASPEHAEFVNRLQRQRSAAT